MDKYLIIPLKEYEDMKAEIEQLRQEVIREHNRYVEAIEQEG